MTQQIMHYRDMFLELLPYGTIWNREDILLQGFADALGDELDTLYQKFGEFKNNISPQNASSLLDEWEADTALPDHCLQASDDEDVRRRNILFRLFERQETTLAWLNGFLQKIDDGAYAIETAKATVTIYHSEVALLHARAGKSRIGERLLKTVHNQNLLCHLQRRIPAGVKLIFNHLQAGRANR